MTASEILAMPDILFDDAPLLPARPSVGGVTPRDYQVACVAEINKGWAEGLRKLLAVMGTGSGKTVVASLLIEIIVKAGGRVLFLAHTDELLIQASEKLWNVTRIEASREKAAERATLYDRVVISSVQTLGKQKRLDRWPHDHFKLVICDESHHSINKSYQIIFDHFSAANLLGLTATPSRSDGRSLGSIFDKQAFDYGLVPCVRDGWLVRLKVKNIPLNIDMRNIAIKRGKDGADLDPDEVARRLAPFLDEIAAQLITHAEQRKTLIFMPSVDTARGLAEKLQSRGARADWASGDRARCPNREERVQNYRDGKSQFMCNAMVLCEGYDDWGVSCVCLLRCTKIVSLLQQVVGRGTRPMPGIVDGLATAEERRAAIAASAKPDVLILDPLWLTDRLDLTRPAHLVAGSIECAEKMLKRPEGDLLEIEQAAERDLLKGLAKEAGKHRKKKGRTFDPFERAVSIGGEDLAAWKPTMPWESLPITEQQTKALAKAGVDTSKITTRGLAAQWLIKLEKREHLGLSSVKQLVFLEKLGISNAAMLTKYEAKKKIARAVMGGIPQFMAEQKRLNELARAQPAMAMGGAA